MPQHGEAARPRGAGRLWRFTRGIRPDRRQLARVMVRRLKEDLRRARLGRYPERHVLEIALGHDAAFG